MKLEEKDFFEKYGEVKVVFAYYYKYSFTFIGEYENTSITVYVGGNADDIYRFDVEPNKEYLVKNLDIRSATIKEGETIIDEYYCKW